MTEDTNVASNTNAAITGNTNANFWAGNNNTNNNSCGSDIEGQCSCDSILSRLIYGYNNYRRTMESLHPNVPTLQMGSNFNNSQPVIGAGFGLASLSGMPFIHGG